jgi:hydrogenase maturation protein HypF
MPIRRQIDVSGVVQGVGFRPYVYRLAADIGLAGIIRNTAAGVAVEVQGGVTDVENFLVRLPMEAPPLARITGIAVREIPCEGDRTFRIVSSEGREAVKTLISPDVAVCPDCLREMFDPADRRFRYPFINCTNCGPRFTIIRNIPYDRQNTSMGVFPMCPACAAEYEDPWNRRFHAQPNACWECGPRVELWDRQGQSIECADPIAEAAAHLRAGSVVAIKGLGGFHLAVDATNVNAVALLRERKRRVEKPLAIMVPGVEMAQVVGELDGASSSVLASAQRPIVLLRKKTNGPLAEEVAPCNKYVGVFLPYTPLHYLLLDAGKFTALVMTSGNISEEPIAIDNNEAAARLGGLADFFLVHNREILLRCDDSVVRISGGKPRQMRRSRGYVPVPVFLKKDMPPILAVGGELKNTVCLTQGKHAFLSQHLGDLENAESFNFFGEAVDHLTKILEIRPEIVAYDLHPDYFSTRWALQQKDGCLVGVQHHHAHIASCMAENHLDGRVIGIALDGTGYGTDGCVWGGEVMLAGYEQFERAAHLEYVPLPGGAAAIREPWRMAVSYLAHHVGRGFLQLPIPFVQRLDRTKTEILLRMMDRNVSSPLTSSCGRLFDAVAALVGIRQQVNFEAQAAIELEMSIDGCGGEAGYPIPLAGGGMTWVLSTRELFEAIVDDLQHEVPAGVISRRFHDGLIGALSDTAVLVRNHTGLDRVCLSGGTFQNVYLSEQLQAKLAAAGFHVFTHSEVPPGDGGLSLGQAMIAAHRSPDT